MPALGKKCDIFDFEIEDIGDENSNHSMADAFKQELTVFGGTMYRDCGIKATFADRCREIELDFAGFENDNNNLKLIFNDKHYPLSVCVNYQICNNSDVITKWYTVENNGNEKIVFEKLFSGEISLPSKKPYIIQNTNGAWAGEFLKAKSTLETGTLVFESRRGTSGHNQAPYFIAYQNANENKGDVYYAALAYSGNFKVEASRDLFGTTRILMGISDFDFSFDLNSGESFETPKIFCGYSSCGFGNMSRQMNKFAIENVLPKSFNKKILPVLYNSWEATGFDVSAAGQMKLAEIAAKTGVELFVVDDGWFGERNSDDAGLGDWFVNEKKFPNGLDELIDYVNSLGMDFGIWIEPEW